jgi:hypothetical protein
MSNIISAFQGMILGASLMLLATHYRTQDGVWISCDLAVISPDFPIAAKEECRRRRQQK